MKNTRSYFCALVLIVISHFAFAINPTDSADMKAVVETQIEAIKDGEFEKAFNLLSTGSKMGGTAKDFEYVMKKDYQMLYKNTGVVFGDPFVQSAKIIVPVSMADLDGDVWIAAFIIVYDDSGWKVDGIVLYKTKVREL